MNFGQYVNANFYLKQLYKIYGNQSINVLDIGAGNHAATRLKKRLPNAKYWGIDIVKDYNNNSEDLANMEDFYEMDLTKLEFDVIPDLHFDVIIMSHIVEHLKNGEVVVKKLLTKLKPGGFIYIEWPSKKSAFLPSMKGTLNFFDDHTHVRFYDVHLLANELMHADCGIVKMGTRRDKWAMILLPYRILYHLFKGKIVASLFWDFAGFASFIFAKKKMPE